MSFDINFLNRVPVWAAAVAVGMLAWGLPGAAQEGSRTEAVRVIKLDTKRLRSPEFSGVTTDSRARSSTANEWIRLTIEFETRNGKNVSVDGRTTYQDEISVEWNILVPRRGDKDVLMHRTVTYLDVADRTGSHYIDMYLRPSFLNRYISKNVNPNDVKVFVQFKINGRTVDKFQSDSDRIRWWEKEPPQVTLMEEVFTRAETPFAPVDYDFYENAKAAERR